MENIDIRKYIIENFKNDCLNEKLICEKKINLFSFTKSLPFRMVYWY